MPCFILYAQLLSHSLIRHSPLILLKYETDWSFRLDMQIMLTLYGILYLDFFQYDRLPPYCVSTKLKPIISWLYFCLLSHPIDFPDLALC